MKKVVFEVIGKGIQQINADEFQAEKLKASSIYICDIKTRNREETVNELRKFDVDESIFQQILEPEEHIRFEFQGNTVYGELAHFSPESDEHLQYIGVIITGNLMFFIYDEGEDILSDLVDSFPEPSEISSKLDIISIFYILVSELLTSHAKLILTYREEIEDFAKKFTKEDMGIDPEEILESKSILSDYSRTIERLHFTLSFPPVKNILDRESPYKLYFQELILTTNVLSESLRLTGERLESLHDHYHLVLQGKSNRRLNFLTIIQAIFVPITLITGLYGMNFVFMPELQFKYGYFVVLGVMLLIVSIFLRYFYKHGWFDQ